jgi:Acetyltransferase (GNAT) domain
MDSKSVYALAVAQGMRIIETESCVWVEKKKFYLESAPGHRRVRLRRGEAAALFLRGAAVLRYSCDEDGGATSFEYVCTDKNFGLGLLAPDARRRVRRGLEACDVRRVECKLLEREGCAINRSVFARQGRVERSFLTDEGMWNRYINVCAGLPNLEAYGAFVNGRLIGFSFGVFVDDYCYLFHTHALSEFMKYSPINAMTYTVTKTALERASVNCVSQGFESFRLLPEVERFKLSMGFYKRSIGRRILVNPLARPLFSAPGVWLLQNVLKRTSPDGLDDLATFAATVREGRMPSARLAHGNMPGAEWPAKRADVESAPIALFTNTRSKLRSPAEDAVNER